MKWMEHKKKRIKCLGTEFSNQRGKKFPDERERKGLENQG